MKKLSIIIPILLSLFIVMACGNEKDKDSEDIIVTNPGPGGGGGGGTTYDCTAMIAETAHLNNQTEVNGVGFSGPPREVTTNLHRIDGNLYFNKQSDFYFVLNRSDIINATIFDEIIAGTKTALCAKFTPAMGATFSQFETLKGTSSTGAGYISTLESGTYWQSKDATAQSLEIYFDGTSIHLKIILTLKWTTTEKDATVLIKTNNLIIL